MVPATSTATSMRCDWMDSRVIRVSPKRQITIPLAFWKALDLSNEVECSLVDGAIVIRPLRRDQDEFSVEILKDLVAQGYSGDELVRQFEIQRNNVKRAVRNLLEEADRIADGSMPAATIRDIFGSDD